MTDPFDVDDLDNDALDAEALRQDAVRTPQSLPPPSMPMDVARVFVEKACSSDGLLTLRHWRGGWWLWRTSCWIEAEDRAVRSLLYRFTEKAVYFTGEGRRCRPGRRPAQDRRSARGPRGDLHPARRSRSAKLARRPIDRGVVSVVNGLLDVEARRLLPHTPQFFNQTSVPFAYEPDAPAPTRWLQFLDELWPAEPDALKVLGEWFGYVISGRTDLQKIFLMIGPTRGGKGVIARVLTALVGPRTSPVPPSTASAASSASRRSSASRSPSSPTPASRAGTAAP